MANSIQIGQLSDAIEKELGIYSEAITEGIKAAVDDASQELLENTRADAPVSSGKYKKAIRIKTVFESPMEKRKKWYVASPRHTLTHLLEDAHKTRNGGMSRAFPHIRENAEKAIESFENKVEEVIKNGGG